MSRAGSDNRPRCLCLFYISSYTWMEAPVLCYCPCLIHSHTLAHTCISIIQLLLNTVLRLWCRPRRVVYTVNIVRRDRLDERDFSRCETQSVPSGSIVEVHGNIKPLEFSYKWGLTLGVLAFTLEDSEWILLTYTFQSAITYNRSPIITPAFYCKYKNPCLTWIQFKREKPNVGSTSWRILRPFHLSCSLLPLHMLISVLFWTLIIWYK